MYVFYVYPRWHKVSFTLIASKHVEYMKKIGGLKVYELDELMFQNFIPSSKPKVIVHPCIFIMQRVLQSKVDSQGRFRQDYYDWWRSNWGEMIGIDVCDSDRMSDIAVSILNLNDKLITHSRFCVEVYKRSGVKRKVYLLPHGVDPLWYELPNTWDTVPVSKIPSALLNIYTYKIRKGKKIILFWLWHSAERKGWYEVREAYRRLRRQRDDVILVLKTLNPNTHEYQQIMDLGAINIYGWLTDYEKMLLYDLADITLNFSRGGGFELNCLESLARGVPCIANEWGSWTDYVPKFLQVKRGRKVKPLPNNAIHVGYGYTVDVDDAVAKINDILDNYDEYKARVEDYRKNVLAKTYRWDIIAWKLYEIIQE